MGDSFAARRKKRPNILLITTDDQGVQAGCYGDPQARTPHMDQLAAEGVRFGRAYVTQASCSPSRSSMFTGLYPHQNGQLGLAHRGYAMKAGMQTMPALLKAAGYRTGVIGKVHVGPSDALPWDWQGRISTMGTRDVRHVAERAGAFLSEVKKDPFFLMVNYFDPHRPYVNQDKGLPAEPVTGEEAKPFSFLGLDTPKIRKEVAGYYNSISRADTGLGMLLRELAAAGKAENTVVIFLGDHGPPFTRGKTTCYEAGLHIPLIVRWPGRAKASHVTDALVSTVDLLPTVLAAAGLPAPKSTAGKSLAELLEGKTPNWRGTLCAEFNSHGVKSYFPRRSIRDDRYKLILNLLQDRPNPSKGVDGCAAWKAAQDPVYDGTPVRVLYDHYDNPRRVELYDLQEDPDEFKNLAGDTAYADIEKRLLGQLQAWREETSDPLLDADTLAKLTDLHDKLKAEKAGRFRPKL